MRAIHVLAVMFGFLVLVGCPSGDDDDSTSDDDAGDDDSQPQDEDGDGFTADDDCNDHDASIHPGAEELCDFRDNDCDGSLSDGETTDNDWDDYVECMDCDDWNWDIHPDADELCDGLDNDCDGAIPTEETSDGDGDGSPACADCDDADPEVYPGKWEDPTDGVDSDCNGEDANDLVTAADWWFVGIQQLEMGGLVSRAGDVDGDGLDDVLLGSVACAPDCGVGHDKGFRVLFGKDLQPGTVSPSLLHGPVPHGVSFPVGNYGSTASFAGDVDGDGLADVLLADLFAGKDSGEVYLLLGATVQHGGEFEPASADVTFHGEDGNNWLGGIGRSLSAGDVDGDGRHDILIGQPYTHHGEPDKVHLFFAATVNSADHHDVSDASADATFPGWGTAVSASGDVDGDDHDDILIGGAGGGSHLVFGTTVQAGGLFELEDADATFLGAGSTVSIDGDHDGDGLDDVLIGRNGTTYLVFGATAHQGGTFDLNEADIVFVSAQRNMYDADLAVSAGDVDGDGRDDILIGQPRYGEGAMEPGKTNLILSATIKAGNTYDLANTGYAFIAPEQALGWGDIDYSGRSLSSAGDVDGDGRDDILIGSLNSAFLLLSPL